MSSTDVVAITRHGSLEEHRAVGTTTWVTASGTSMEPLIPAGSRLLVEFGRRPPAVGSVIVFRRGDRVLAHRLVARRSRSAGDVLVARGDNEAFFDPDLSGSDVLGIVRTVIRPDGRLAASAIGRRRGLLIARVSHPSGRAAGVGVRALRRGWVSESMRRAGQGAVISLSRVPTRVITALMPRFDREVRREGGDST